MADLQESSSAASTSTTSPANPSGQEGSINTVPSDLEKLIESLLLIPDKRDHTLATLFKKMESGENLAPLLWNSVNTVFILILEIISVYRLVSTPNLTQKLSNRANHAVCLFKCIASHPVTRTRFLKSKILSFIYPFMETKIQDNKPHETVRTGSLSVFDGLLTHQHGDESDDDQVVKLLLETKILPCCITCMKVGNAKSKSVALNIIRKILENDAALNHFSNAARALDALTSSVPHILRCRVLLRQIDDPVVTNDLNTLIRRVTGRAMHQRQ
ncbi:hypothetical protein Dsin_031687 [Dipteronia sinensis]|uniref:Uncharacterized protein n=1 Tax=Dipteronia sinensis TaxID=43782 RepID=A0AAD9ZLJ5_9ROSI|nr:hypothetical protein Dsin_031687 [Dipteronia sinensis]